MPVVVAWYSIHRQFHILCVVSQSCLRKRLQKCDTFIFVCVTVGVLKSSIVKNHCESILNPLKSMSNSSVRKLAESLEILPICIALECPCFLFPDRAFTIEL